METSGGEFREASCRVNRWMDCIDQQTEKHCKNIDKRDCFWAKGLHYDGSGSKTNGTKDVGDKDAEGKNKGILNGGFICLPENPPGLKFWEESDAASVCSLGHSRQVVGFETDFFKLIIVE